MNTLEQMHEQGYIVIPQVINQSEIQTIRNSYKLISRKSGLSTLLPTDILKHPYIFNILLKENITSEIRDLFGRNFSLFPNFTIRESVYIPWHNDAYFLPQEVIHAESPLQFMQCAIYLQDNDPELGGGITLIPGSHHLAKSVVDSMLETPLTYEKTVMSKAGDLVLWDNRISHRSTYPDKTPDSTKLALQWTVSASLNHNESYLNYLRDRAHMDMHVSDFLPKSPKPYFIDMPNVVYPASFHQDSLHYMSQQHIQFIGL
ncbi:phytanoyl-CoA dioxygenase family protein [Enterobacter mori]|uniref:phytanoyl-CoA dioxygenase family protein n=1 Tax=Enterobacter mori TaxID=539813 RepID=UPI002ED33A72|nr:phytanoyl-CoA dioxygenase family protein [Enterobacter mori]